MLVSPTRKNKIVLSDYNYQKDLENRLLMARFTAFDVKFLEEILNSSIKIPIQSLANDLDSSIEKVLSSIEIFSKVGLLKLKEDLIIVNKEMRKYYEFLIMKFDNEFKPNVDFLQNLLKKVPIHILPTWYSIPRSSDNIFRSIIEKYLATPKLFERYLLDLNIEDEILNAIAKDVHNAPDFKLRSKDLREKYDLSREKFEMYMLHMEFNFLGFLSYTRIGEEWKEVVSPLYEWCEYKKFVKNTIPSPIEEASQDLIPLRKTNFAVIKDLKLILKLIKNESISLKSDNKFPSEIIEILMSSCECMPHFSKESLPYHQDYFLQIIEKACEIHLAKIENESLLPTQDTDNWIEMDIENNAMYLLRHPNNCNLGQSFPESLQSDRNIRSVEKSLKRISHNNWIILDNFIEGMIHPIGSTPGVFLDKKGRNWKYITPNYSPKERLFIKSVIFNRFFQAGITEIGTYKEKEAFRITEFGKKTIN